MTATRQTVEVPEEFFAIAELLRTQDNARTAHAMFRVDQKQRDYGFDPDCSDQWVLLDSEGNEIDNPDLIQDWEEWDSSISYDVSSFESKHEYTPGDIRRVYFQDRWETVAVFFTRAGAEDYIMRNAHRLKEPRIDVDSAYRNDEWIMIREWLMGLKKEES